MTSSPPDSAVQAPPDPASATASAPAAPTLRQLLGVRPYVKLWASRTLSALAMQMQSVAVGWHVYSVARQTGTINEAAFAVGMLGLSAFLPIFVLMPIAGDTVDRYDRRKVMRAAVAVQLMTAVAFLATTLIGLKVIWPLYLIAACFGAARAFSQPASASLAPMLVGPVLLPRAIVFSSSGNQLAQITGPALGGLLVAVSPTLAFGASAILFTGSTILLSTFRAPKSPPVTASRGALIAEGLSYVWRTKIVLGAISLDLFAVLLGGATGLLPVFARDILHVGPQGFGILRASPAIGALISGFFLSFRPTRTRVGVKMFCAVACYGAATVVFGLSRSMILSVAALAVLGASDMVSVFIRQSLVQIVTPGQMRGRVSAVSTLFIGASNELGEFESGTVARLLGPIGSVLFGGVGALVVTGLWAWLFPALRKADRFDHPAAGS